MKMENLKDRVDYALKQSGLKAGVVAQKIGCKASAISMWGTTSKSIRNDLLFKFADLTGFSPRWISTGEDDDDPFLAEMIRVYRNSTDTGKIMLKVTINAVKDNYQK